MKNMNGISFLLYSASVLSIAFGLYVQSTIISYDDNLLVGVGIGSVVLGFFFVGIGEIVRLLNKISNQLTKQHGEQKDREEVS